MRLPFDEDHPNNYKHHSSIFYSSINTKFSRLDKFIRKALLLITHLVIFSFGPEKLGPGRKMPAATSLVVFTPNLSANMLIEAFGYCFCNSKAVDNPTTPAPKTAKLIEIKL